MQPPSRYARAGLTATETSARGAPGKLARGALLARYEGIFESIPPPFAFVDLDALRANARFMLGETGMVVAREDLAMEAAFWAQLPGNFVFRSRKAPITSRNFAAMSPFHNYPSGRATGNHWGNALTMFVTSALSPYYFSIHASDPTKPDGGSRKDVGHMSIFGPVGTGKTTVLGFLVAMLDKFGIRLEKFGDSTEMLAI